ERETQMNGVAASSIHTFSCRAVPSTSNGAATPPIRPNRDRHDSRSDSPVGAGRSSRRASASVALHVDSTGRRLRFRMGGHTYTME
ncbi:hypothetical protein PFISCL1PPCAC_20681, partial [Pristionchus fissidentatus]